MKKVFVLLLVLTICICAQAQRSALIIDAGYRNKFDYTNWGIGLQYKYNLPLNLRVAADVMGYIPEESDFGLDIGVNIQYKLPIQKNLSVYPFAGVIISNHSFSADPNARNQTEFGVSLGFGAEYNVSKSGFINIDYRYNLIHKEKPAWYRDYSLIRLGYGFRF